MPFARRFKPDRWYAHELRCSCWLFYASFVAAFAIRTFLFQPFSIPSGSMVPTLQDGDHLFVSKFAYGYSRYSVPFELLPIEGRHLGCRAQTRRCRRVQISADPNVDYIQRIVGLPGEKIQIVDGVLHINGMAVVLEDIGDYVSEEISTQASA